MKNNEVQSGNSTDNLLDNKEKNEGFVPCRYLVAFMGFLTYSLVNCQVLSTSIAIVAMVNSSATNVENILNNNVSCPQNIESGMDYHSQEYQGEFNWSPAIEGYVLGAYFLGFVFFMFPGGLLAETFGAKVTINTGIFISSVCHLLSPFAAWSSSYLMIALQLLKGMAQGLLPAAIFVLSANWYPINERGFLTTFIFIGLCFGSFVGAAASGALCSSAMFGGWPSVFYVFGAVGIVLSILYTFVVFESPKQHPRIGKNEVKYILENQETELFQKRPPTPWLKIVTSVPFYAMVLAVFGQTWAQAYFLEAHPIFVGTVLHFPIAQNGLYASIPFVLQAAFTALASFCSYWLTKNNYVGLNKVRKGCNLLSSVGYSMCLLGVYFAGCHKLSSILCAMLASAFSGFDYSGSMINPVELSPTFSGSVTGLGSLIACSANYIVPIFVGHMTQKEQSLEQWNKIFFISIAVVMTSSIIFAVFGSAEVQPWNFPKTKKTSKPEKGENKKDVVNQET